MSCTTRDLGEFVVACHRIGAYGLVRCSSGNLSWRLDEDDDLIAISGTRAWLSELEESDVALCRIPDGQSLNDQKPSVEVGMHLGILANRKDVNVVLHFQTPCATALACGQPEKVNFFVVPEIPYYIGPIGIVDYHTPGTAELAAATATVMLNPNRLAHRCLLNRSRHRSPCLIQGRFLSERAFPPIE